MIVKKRKPFRVVASSVRGAGHEANGAPCEDAHAYLQLPAGETVFGVCDGAGSRPLAAIGARIATQATVKALASFSMVDRIGSSYPGEHEPASLDSAPPDPDVWETRMLIAFRQARRAVEAEAQQYQVEPGALASTLLAGVLFPNGYLVYGQIGDGRIITLDGVLDTEEIQTPPTMTARTKPYGEYANETIFLTSKCAFDEMEIGCTRRPVSGVAAFTDGLSHIGFDLKAQVPRGTFLNPLFQIAAQGGRAATHEVLGRFLRSDRIRTRTKDDVTLLIAAAPQKVHLPGVSEQAKASEALASR